MKNKVTFLFIFFILFIFFNFCFSYQIPTEENGLDFFYTFGKGGCSGYGADDNIFILFIAVPYSAEENVLIKIFDPNVKERHDERDGEWDTSTKFSVFGGKGAFTDSRSRIAHPTKDYYTGRLLYEEKFSSTECYDDHWIYVGPFAPEQGERIGKYYIFKLVVEGLEGNDNNLFKFDISPDMVEVFSYNISIRLAKAKGKHMKFFPYIPKGVNKVIVTSFDMDVTGGNVMLISETGEKKYKLEKSYSGKTRSSEVFIERPDVLQKWILEIVKGTQSKGNASIYIKNQNNVPLRIYFKPKEHVPQLDTKVKSSGYKCNIFTFDASSSYDVNNRPLSFHWDFGDGHSNTESVVTHIYERGGEYTVTLTVTNDSGLPCESAITTKVIKVNSPPAALFKAPTLTCVNKEVMFDAGDTTDYTSENLSYYWDFGDGTTGEGKTVTKSYKIGGMYKIILRVDDNEETTCSIGTFRKTIHVNTSPMADAGEDIVKYLDSFEDEYKVTFDGSRSKDTDNNSLTYIWDFGDGEEGIGEEVNHVYEKSGVYEVKLTVDDGIGSTCSTDTDTVKVSLDKPPKAVINIEDKKKVCVGEKITFDGTKSLAESGETLTYKWDFGDGTTAEGEKTEYVYKEGGAYSVTLVVDDGRGTSCSVAKDSIAVSVNSGPTVKLKSVDTICVGKRIIFDATDSYDPDGDSLTYKWDFGDGTTAKVNGNPKISHTYKEGGIYKVTVLVDDGKGFDCSEALDRILVEVNTSPIAKIDADTKCCAGMKMMFDASGSRDPDGDELTYKWNFGDGITTEGEKVTHVYEKGGNYIVILTVDDKNGTECSSSKDAISVNVNEKPVPIIKIR